MTIHWGPQSRWQTDVSIKNHIVTMPEELWVEALELIDTGRDAKRKVAALRAELQATPEWRDDGYCQRCMAFPKYTHAPNCPRQVALGLAQKGGE